MTSTSSRPLRTAGSELAIPWAIAPVTCDAKIIIPPLESRNERGGVVRRVLVDARLLQEVDAGFPGRTGPMKSHESHHGSRIAFAHDAAASAPVVTLCTDNHLAHPRAGERPERSRALGFPSPRWGLNPRPRHYQ